MNTEAYQLMINGQSVDVVRKNIKNLHLAVYPPAGRIRISIPLRLSDNAVRMAIITRWAWIKRQQAKLKEQARQSARDYVTGESHYFQGQHYRLNVIFQNGPSRVVIHNKNIIDMFVREGSTTSQRKKILREWYREQLKTLIPPLIEKWENIIGVNVAKWSVKQMKTRWGTCTIRNRHIWLNLELVKKPILCLEYIIVHEMIHLSERHHNEHFVALMNTFMPKWKEAKALLLQYPLADEKWNY